MSIMHYLEKLHNSQLAKHLVYESIFKWLDESELMKLRKKEGKETKKAKKYLLVQKVVTILREKIMLHAKCIQCLFPWVPFQ